MNAALIHAATKLLQDPPNPEGDAGYTPVIVKTTDETPAAANSTQSTPAANSTQSTPAVAARTWHHTAMSAATFTLSAILAHIATKAICKRIRGRN